MMAGLWECFQLQSLPNSKETSLGEGSQMKQTPQLRDSWRKNEMMQKVENKSTTISHQNKGQR